jgi:hypothetical protein
LTGFGARAAVGTLTGAALGVPLGAAAPAIENVAALANGTMSTEEYLERVGWGAVLGGIAGAITGFLSAAFSRPAPGDLTTRPPAAHEAFEADVVYQQPQVDPETGVVSQLALHRPTGQHLRATYDPVTRGGQIVNLSTGQQVAVVVDGVPVRAPRGLLPGGGALPGGSAPEVPVGAPELPVDAPELPVDAPELPVRGGQPELLDHQQAVALRSHAARLRAEAARQAEAAEFQAVRLRPDRAARMRLIAEERLREAAAADARAEEYESGRRSARSELPGVEDFPEFFESTDEVPGGYTLDRYTQIRLSSAERDPSQLARLARELMTSTEGNRVVYRIDGGKGRGLLSVDDARNVTVAPGNNIHLNFGSPERALEFLNKDTKGGDGARLVRFEVSEEWVRAMRSGAAPEAAALPRSPQLVDVKYADDQMMVPAEQVDELQRFIVPGSGREVVVDELKSDQR